MIRPHPRWDRLSFASMRRLQARRLRRFLRRQVFPFSSYYRRLWRHHGLDPSSVRTVSDLSRFPLTEKKDLADQARDFILQPTPVASQTAVPRAALVPLLLRRIRSGRAGLQRALVAQYAPTSAFFTTGRTAGPTPVFLTPYDERLLRVAGGRIVDVLDLVPPLDRGLSLFPFAPHLAFWQVVACGRARALLTLHSGGGRAMGTEAILRLMKRMKPTFLVGIPGFTAHVLRHARREGVDLSRIRLVAAGGDALTPALEERLARRLPREARVLSVYGFTESRVCWTECAPGTGFHTYPDLGLFEVIDPDTGETLPAETTGELVYTSLDGRGSALVRYRTGDIARGGITYAPCPECGRTLPRISRALTRRADGLVKIKGTLVDLTVLADAVAGDPNVQEWQAEITEQGGLEIYVAMLDGAPDGLARRISVATEVRPDRIHVEPLERLVERLGLETRMKEARIVDRRAAPAEAKR
ncbi:MAG: phenylacetate--CoA ligase family protein [Planctomycetota bacterium]